MSRSFTDESDVEFVCNDLRAGSTGPGMSRPRRICADDTVMKQKRCYNRELRLRPDRIVVQIILYALAYTAQKYSIVLHEFCVLGNHDHLIFSDPKADRPAFIGLFHSLVTRAVNNAFGEWDSLWSSQPYSAPRMLSPADMLRKIVYVLLNPVAAKLVRYAWEWGGPSSWGLEYGVPLPIKRPAAFFSDDMPEVVELVIHRPPGLRPDLSDRDLRAFIREETKRQQGDLVAKILAQGGSFLGMQRVLKQPRHDRPSSSGGHFTIRPTVIAGDRQKRIDALAEEAAFRAEHERCRQAFITGDRNVVFPYGTYLMRVRIGCACASP